MILKNKFRALCSKTPKKTPIFKTYFGFSFLDISLDIYKCPKSISLFTFGKIFVTET